MPAVTPERDHPPPIDRLVQAWAGAITGTSYVAMSRAELVSYLDGLAKRLIRAADPATAPDPRIGYEIGQSLVAAHFTNPSSLDRTISALATELLAEEATSSRRVRVADLLGGVAAGFGQALRERTLTEQEEIRAAVASARVEAEAAQAASEARFRAVFAGAAIGIGIGDVDGHVLDVNDALCQMLGYSTDELRRIRIPEFMHPDDSPQVWTAYRQLISGERDNMRIEKPYYRKDGQQIWTDLVVSLIRGPDGRPRYMVAMIEDVTERHMLQTRLLHQAQHDPLTGLPNRVLFFERLAQVLGGEDADARIGVCYLDVDEFRVVNDTLGHDVGDQWLREVAERLASAVCGPGQLVARTGGDEFVLLVERSRGTEHMVRLAELALDAVRTPVHLAGHAIAVSASVGVVECLVHSTSAAELMKAADTTLYWAKEGGRNRWALFDPERHRREVTKFELSASLPVAYERGEFVVEYQPLVGLPDGKPIGVEALVRWHHPSLGLLGPDRFIGIAEGTGLIVPLGRWVLRTACAQAAAWRSVGTACDLLMSVNVAVRQLRDPGLVGDVVEVLRETGLPPDRLQLELTESAVMSTVDGAFDALHALARLGVRLAIDDFGTGYSNLAYLKHLPVATLKLAGSFVTGLRSPGGPDPVDEKILGALIDLAHTLGLTVTAEEVETAEQAARLAELGCDTAQGWYYHRPAPAETISELIHCIQPAPARAGDRWAAARTR